MSSLQLQDYQFCPEDLDNRDFSKTTLKPLLGTGPYQLHNYRVGNQITYKHN